jgi:predicted dinucleotide-binding enzyme
MRIAILGTGGVGRALASQFVEHGHEVVLGTRDVAATLSRTTSASSHLPCFADWYAENPLVDLASLPDAASSAPLVVNALEGSHALEGLAEVGAARLAGKILIDTANPLDFSRGRPPFRYLDAHDSLAEQIQRSFPAARVVKTFSTMTTEQMVNPMSVPGLFTVFLSGDDPEAKRVVADLISELGHWDLLDLGDVTTARAPELLLPVWIQLRAALGTSDFNFRVVR